MPITNISEKKNIRKDWNILSLLNSTNYKFEINSNL